MKRIEATIRPERLHDVKTALRDLGVRGMTVYEARGHGIQGGVTQQWRGEDYVVDLLPKVTVVAVVNEHEVADCLDVIARAARTGRIGDGKIFVSQVEQAMRIRTGETGSEAL